MRLGDKARLFPRGPQRLFLYFFSLLSHSLSFDRVSLRSKPNTSMFRLRFGFRTSYLLPSTILLICLISTSSAKCYFPNGKLNSNYEQCTGYVSCCLKGDSCLSNGLCFGPKLGILYRGPCANESWPAALCPDACYKGKITILHHQIQ